MKVVTSLSLPRLGFFLSGAAIGLAGCQSGAVPTSELVRSTAFAIEASANLQDGEEMTGAAEGAAEGDGVMDAGSPAKPAEDGAAKDGDAKGKDKKSSPAEKLADATEERVLAEQKRSYAETESELAKLDQQAGEIEVAESLRAKREALQIARDELTNFESRKMPLELRESDLSLERSADRLLKAETDLANMREIMSEEAEAKNKGEIIRRYEKTFEFAQESLSIQSEERALLVEAEHPSKLAKLSGAVRAAEAKLQAEEIHADRKLREADLKVRKAKHGFDAAKRKFKKASREEKKLKQLKAGAGEGKK